MKISLAIPTPDVTLNLPVALLSGAFEERLSKAARLGYDGVELMTARPAELNPAEIQRKVRQSGLEVSAVSSGAVYMMDRLTLLCAEPDDRPRAAARLLELIDFAAEVGAPVVTLGGFRGRLAWARGADARPYLTEVLRRASVHASRHGVQLALEPLNRYETDLIQNVSEALIFISQIDTPTLGVLFDTFHANIEEAQPVSSLRQALQVGRLLHVHLGDSNRLPPGQGHFDFAGMVEVLRQGGYAGYLSAELLPRPDPDRAAALTIQAMRQLVTGPVLAEASR